MAQDFRSPSRSGSGRIAELCARCRDAEGGRKDKPGGMFVDRNRLSPATGSRNRCRRPGLRPAHRPVLQPPTRRKQASSQACADPLCPRHPQRSRRRAARHHRRWAIRMMSRLISPSRSRRLMASSSSLLQLRVFPLGNSPSRRSGEPALAGDDARGDQRRRGPPNREPSLPRAIWRRSWAPSERMALTVKAFQRRLRRAAAGRGLVPRRHRYGRRGLGG